ncbi:MAG: hypothetical protein ACOZDY_03105 [Pseudomonadota bacterium]
MLEAATITKKDAARTKAKKPNQDAIIEHGKKMSDGVDRPKMTTGRGTKKTLVKSYCGAILDPDRQVSEGADRPRMDTGR